MLDRLKKLLSSPRAPYVAALVAVILFLPALRSGLLMDDLVHRVSFEPGFLVQPRRAWDLFAFQGPDRGLLARHLDLGAFPWWTAPTFRLAFFRPLSGLSHWFDYHYLSDHVGVMHAENIALFAGMTLFAAHLYRRLVTPLWAAGLAGLLFAIDDAHAFVVQWIANRNAVLAGFFGLGALWLHDRARRDGARWAGYLAPAALVLGLLSGEAAVATLAYLAAYALFLDERSPLERVRSLAPYFAVLVVWILVYKVSGYGAAGGGFYIDPGAEPVAFLTALLRRLPILVLAQVALPPSELWSPNPGAPVAPVVVAAAFLVALGLVFARVLRRDRTAAFFATGMLLSLVPVAATLPSDRLLLFSGFGAFGLIATFVARVAELQAPRLRLLAKVVAASMLLIHALIAPVLLPVRVVSGARMLRGYTHRANASLPADLGKTLVVVNAPDTLVVSNVAAIRFHEKKPLAERMRQLAVIVAGTETLERLDDRTLSVTASEGFLRDLFSELFRNGSLKFHPGEVVTLPGMRAEIVDLCPTGEPRRVDFHFDADLDDPSFHWVTWEGTRFVDFAVPRKGEKVTLPAIDYVSAMFGKKS